MSDTREINPAKPAKADPFNDPEHITTLRAQMLQFANLQLNDSHLAEDAVQEALAGAMKNAQSFAGKSAFKTWVFAILKNKIADVLRKRHRLQEVNSLASDDEDEEVNALFDKRGHWNPNAIPTKWDDPESSFKQTQFWHVFETCLNELPGKQARVFMMREYIGLESEEICCEMDLTVSNLHVLLHRARVRLQKCLTSCWFEGGAHA